MAFGRQSAVVVANSLVGAAQGFLALFLVARYLGDEVLGARAFALSLVTLLGVVCRLGFPITHARRLARGDDVPGSVGTFLLLKLGLTGAFAVAGAAFGVAWFGWLDKGVTDTTPMALLYGYFIVIAQSLREFTLATFRGLRRILHREGVLLTNTIATVLLTSWVCLAYAFHSGRWVPFESLVGPAAQMLAAGPFAPAQALDWVMLAFLVGDVAALLLGLYWFLRLRIPIGRPSTPIARDYLRATVPLMVLSVLGIMGSRISQVMLGYWGDASELGQFAGAAKLSEVLLLLASGIMIVLLPAVSTLDSQGRRGDLAALVVQAERWISLLGWPVAVFVALAPRAVLHVTLSDDFLAAAPLLVLMCFHTLVTSVRMPLQTKALGLGEHHFAARVAGATLLVTVLLNLALVPDALLGLPMAGLGATGAALAVLGSGLVPLLSYRRKAREWTGHPYFSRHLRRHVAAAALTFLVFWFAVPRLPVEVRVWTLLAYAIAVLAVYLAFLFPLRELGRKDLHAALGMLGLKTSKNDGEVAPP